MEQIFWANGLTKETVTAIMIPYRNTKVKVCSPDGNAYFFILSLEFCKNIHYWYICMFIICLDYVLQMSIDLRKENGFTLKKARSRQYLAKTIMNTDYPDDIAFLRYTPTQFEFLWHSLEQVPGGIGLHMNTSKMEYMYFNQEGATSTLNGHPLKLVHKFTYSSSSNSYWLKVISICT